MEAKLYCKNCNTDVVPVIKVFNTKLCPKCNVILSSNIGIG